MVAMPSEKLTTTDKIDREKSPVVSPAMVLRMNMVANKLCTLPKTFDWVLHNNGQDWDEDIKRDLLRNCPSMEAHLMMKVEQDLAIVLKGMEIISKELAAGEVLTKSGVLKNLRENIVEPKLTDKLLQNFFLGRLGPDSFLPSRNFKRAWSEIFKTVAQLYRLVDLVDPHNPLYKTWVSLKKNIETLDDRFGILFDIQKK